MRKNILEANRKLNMRYRLIRSIGQGGFGITYVAEDEVMKQHVVIKEYFPVMLAGRSEQGELILPDTADEKEKYQEGMKRFLNEAKILASLFDVPGVVKVLDYFQENQTAYIVMEYVKGTSLRDYLESMGEELSFEKTCEMLKPVMIALEKVHQKGLLHRDISPDNLMVEEDGKIKMLDFGSAREYFLEQDREKTLTILVKNGYAPPEQYEGKGEQGPWTDVYALCATMYEMMTGCMPPNSKERELEDELYAPSTYDVEITPEQEEAFLTKGLALAVKDRYKSIREMMEGFLLEEREKKEKKDSGKKWILSVAGALMLLGLAGLVSYLNTRPDEKISAYAGSFERGSEAYEDFIEYVEENAVSAEKYTGTDGFETTLYTLDEEAVKELNMPCNMNSFEMTEEKLVDAIKEKGYILEKTGSGNSFEAEVGGYGSVKTAFLTQDNYETPDGVLMEVRYEYFTKEITFLRLSNMNDMQADYSQLAADITGILAPDLAGEMTSKDILEVKAAFEEREGSSNEDISGFETSDIFIRFLWRDKIDEATICFFPYGISYEEPAYRW